MSENAEFIHRNGIIIDKSYVEWLSEVKARFQRSQIKAAIRVNSAMLEFYWSLGHDIVSLKAESKWGSGFFNQLSLDLKEIFPNQTGFSVTNLKYMKRWYAFYYENKQDKCISNSNRHQDGDDSAGSEYQPPFDKKDPTIRHRVGDELENTDNQPYSNSLQMPDLFGRIPWKHHVEIFTRCKDIDEALFYINKTIENNWSKPELENHIQNGLYIRQGAAITNFDQTLPSRQRLLAQEILKDPYDMSFLGIKDFCDERELEDALVSNVSRFLIELGQGFAFVGRQMELKMPGGQTFFPDLIFYHIHLKCYVVVELKVVPFAPEFAGKINFYVNAADELLKRDDDNPTVGLIICKSTDKTVVEWSFRGIDRPLGVATYQLQEVVERTVKEIESRKTTNNN